MGLFLKKVTLGHKIKSVIITMHAMKRQLALSLLLLILSLQTVAQNHTIAGTVVDETGAVVRPKVLEEMKRLNGRA